MTHYTLGTAANACGVNKSTVLRAIKAGKVSATRNEHGEWQIDPAEMHRVYPPVAATDAVQQGEQRHALASAPRPHRRACGTVARAACRHAQRARPRSHRCRHLAHGFRAGAHATCPPRPWQRCAIPGNNPCNADPSGRHDCAAPGAGCGRRGEGYHGSGDRRNTHGSYPSSRRFPLPCSVLTGQPGQYLLALRASGRDCCRKMGSLTEPLKNAAFKTNRAVMPGAGLVLCSGRSGLPVLSAKLHRKNSFS